MKAARAPISEQEALIYAMVTVSAADRIMSDRELRQIGDIVRALPIFAGFADARLVDVAKDCGALLQGGNGLERVLEAIAANLPQRLHDTVYALAVEVAAADLRLEQEELRFLQLLRNRLDIDNLTAAAIERSARARYRKN